MQREILNRKAVIFGIKETRGFEFVNRIQCLKCSRFDHFARTCGSGRKCAGLHSHSDCAVLANAYKCANCITENTRHRANGERCPARTQRIEVMKRMFIDE